MGKLFKKFIGFVVVSLLGYLAIWLYTKIKAAVNLDRSLPQYLKNVYDEDTEISVRIAFRNYSIVVKCSEVLMEKSDLVKQTVLDYIDDFYPEFKSDNLNIIIKSLEDENQ